MSHANAKASWGGAVRFDTGSEQYLGWIVAETLVASLRTRAVLADGPAQPAFAAEERKQKAPFAS